MRLVLFSSLFPSALAPNAGIFIRERMFRVARHVPMIVVAPVAWSPFDWLVRRLRPGFRPYPLPFEVMDGIEIFRPRYFSIPGVLKRLDGWLMALCCYPTMRRLQRSFKPTLIDAHFLYPDGFAAAWLGRRLSIPVTVSIRGSKDQRLVGTACEGSIRWTLRQVSGVLAVSDQLVVDVARPLGATAEQVTVIGNGVDLQKFKLLDRAAARHRSALPPDARVLLGVGNLIELKGFQRVIPLLADLRKRFPTLIYVIVGGPAQQSDLLPALKQLAEEQGVADIVRFCGALPQSEPAWLYSAADLFVLATAYEGWANVFLEAMACGLPVISTKVGGNSQVVPTEDLGTLVDFWDPDAFALAVTQALERKWDRGILRQHAEAYSWEQRVETLLIFLARSSREAT